MARTKPMSFSTMLTDWQFGASASGSCSPAQASHFGSVRGLAATAHCRFLLLMFCLILCLRGLASAQIQETFTDADGNGFWSDGNNWSPPTDSGGPNGNFNVTIPAGTGGPTGGAILDVSTSIVNLVIDVNASLSVTNGSILAITGTEILNAGQLTIADLTNFDPGGQIIIQNTATLVGSGVTALNSAVSNSISGPGTLINKQTINGEAGGLVDVNLHNLGPNGRITGGPSTNPLTLTGEVKNSGLISGLGFTTVEFSMNTVVNTGGTIDAGASGGQILLNGCFIIGGTIGSASTVPGGLRSTALRDVTITGTYSVTSTSDEPARTTLLEGITNNGQIVVTAPPFEEPATLYIEGAVILAGTGQVALSGTNASITGEGSDTTLINVSPHVINGGNIRSLALTNQSLVSNSSNIAVKTLDNTGGTISNPATITAGVVQNGTIVAGVNPGVTLTGGVTLSGVTLTGGAQGVANSVDAVLDGLKAPNIILTNLQINDDGKLTLDGPVDVDSPGGEILIEASESTATVVVEGPVSMSGTGELVTSESPNNDIIGAAGTRNSFTISVPTVATSGLNLGDGTFPITFSAPTTVTSGGYPLIINSTSFKNLGMLDEDNPSSLIEILGPFTNFNSTTNTLTGGTYMLDGTLQFNNANVVNNAAKLMFTGNGQILDQNGGNGLVNFNNNAANGTFELSGEQSFETGGTFSNEGKSIISAGSDFTVGGTGTNYNQSGKSAITTVDGRLIVPAGGLVNITGGLVQSSGQFEGDVSVGNPTGGAAATFIVADSKKSSALVTMFNNYTQLATGVMDVQIGGTTAGTEYSQLSATGAVTLGGTLNVALINRFKPVSGDQFTVINAPSGVTGTFATVNLPKTFQVVYNPTSVEVEVQ